MDDESFEEAFQLAGWLLAHQASIAANGEVPLPLVSFTRDGTETAQLVAPRTDSDSYDRQVLAGRVVLGEQAAQFRSWVFSYDEDLGLAGRALFVEVGGQEFGDVVTLAQRYVTGGEQGFRLIGDLEVLGLELLPAEVQGRLESCRWRYLVTEGATNHDPAGQHWIAWYSARDHMQVRLGLGEFHFTVPEGLVFRRTEDDDGWLILRLVPWEEKQYEPTIMTLVVEMPGQGTLEEIVAHKQEELLKAGWDLLEAEVSALPSLPSPAARIRWDGETGDRSFRTEWVWVPTEEPERFLLVCATCFDVESWDSLRNALEAVLASLGLEEG